ncbi:MYB-like transcription factor ETC3 [Dioscorea cayenensis subsp. rotundata]|uniref:MYB-like transcription factor ETC3 n=1 Tax=Dioscorea cayennensis subsp. rotundata TaxID=55577 RepID=A0AB40B6T3_DIOCR|nr:MYB-like transcription factor ETC3 [Dioscorea cayenensis subsp. rotundata]XP_039122966.1 MYB-like transcription factor ETC3 [Dioscorea cayenensis subsp. rotundata]
MEEDEVQEIKDMSLEEKDLIHRLYRLLGDRWEMIAGRLPNRTAEEVEKYWKMKEIENFEKNKIYKPICIRLGPSFKFSMNN